ncbi:hypothetical protein ACFQPA_14365 [Halomarina halobia]|uniref:DUF7344 domain-containing protein n=1 Tax=Halomarina halobia TaxID=3033386 RepID=A0ABD6A830_9EURY|nr:hypothetical protein [Halomarina sp. PSR21]
MSNWNPTMALGTALSLVAHAHRRAVLYCLLETDEPMTRDELAARIIAWDEATEGDPSDEVHRRVCTELAHTHLPKLAAVDVIEYDTRHGDVVLTERVNDLLPLLELLRPVDDFPAETCSCPCQ